MLSQTMHHTQVEGITMFLKLACFDFDIFVVLSVQKIKLNDFFFSGQLFAHQIKLYVWLGGKQ